MNGTNLYAVRYSTDNKAPSLFYRQREQGIAFVSEPLDEHYSDWTMLKPGTMAVVDESNSLKIMPLI